MRKLFGGFWGYIVVAVFIIIAATLLGTFLAKKIFENQLSWKYGDCKCKSLEYEGRTWEYTNPYCDCIKLDGNYYSVLCFVNPTLANDPKQAKELKCEHPQGKNYFERMYDEIIRCAESYNPARCPLDKNLYLKYAQCFFYCMG